MASVTSVAGSVGAGVAASLRAALSYTAPQLTHYPIGAAMNKNLSVRMGNCNHRAVTPPLIDLVAAGLFDPTSFITQEVGVVDALERRDTVVG